MSIIVGCGVSDKSAETNVTNDKTIAPSVTTILSTSNISTESKNKASSYTVKDGDTFFSIAVSLFPDKDLSAATDTLKKLNPYKIEAGDIIICPKKEDIPDYYISIVSSLDSLYDSETKDLRYRDEDEKDKNKIINSELGIKTTDFLVVRRGGVYEYFSPVDKNANKVLYPYQKNNKWGLINGNALVVMEPTHAMVTTLGHGKTTHYLVSDNKDKPFTGFLYTSDGKKIFDFEVGLIGGGPDSNTPHIRTDVFTYEENNKLGLITINNKKITPAVYDTVRDDYHGSFMIASKGDIKYFFTPSGKISTPEIPGLSLMGSGDNVISEYSSVKRDNTTTIYKSTDMVFETEYYIDQIDGGFVEFTDEGTNTYNLNFDKLHSFPKEYEYVLYGPNGATSYSGYLLFKKDNKYILCTKDGKELITMDESFSAKIEDKYFKISIFKKPDKLYDFNGNFIKEVEENLVEDPIENNSQHSFISTAFYSDNSYYRSYYVGWFTFISEDFEYTFPYNTYDYFATQ